MEKLISAIEAHSAATGLKPQKILRDAIGASWGQWDRWKAGEQFPRMDTVDKLMRWMEAHPPKQDTAA